MGVKVYDGADWKTVTATPKVSIDGGATWRSVGSARFYDPVSGQWMNAVTYTLSPPSALAATTNSLRSPGAPSYTWTHSPSSNRTGYQMRFRQQGTNMGYGPYAFTPWIDVGNGTGYTFNMPAFNTYTPIEAELRTVFAKDGITWVASTSVALTSSWLPLLPTAFQFLGGGGSGYGRLSGRTGTNIDSGNSVGYQVLIGGTWYGSGTSPLYSTLSDWISAGGVYLESGAPPNNAPGTNSVRIHIKFNGAWTTTQINGVVGP